MAFGYTLLRGKDGAAGHVKTADGTRSVLLRGIAPGERCEAFSLETKGAVSWGTETADRTGQAQFSCRGSGPLFIIAGGRMRLWEGGEETYLRAAAWLRDQEKKEKSPAPPPLPPREDHEKESPPIETGDEKEPEKETYALRAPGLGEPVDTLPERL